MAEILKPTQQKSLWEQSKPPKGEEGVLGPIDTANRLSYRFSKPAVVVSGIATLLFPIAFPVFVGTVAWAGGDKLAIESSKWVRRKISGDMKPGEPVELPKKVKRSTLALAA